MLPVAWHGMNGRMVTGPDGRGWTLRESFALDFKISRISHDFGTFKFLLKFLKSFKISKVATKKHVLFFSMDNHWQNVDLWADVFFCEFFRPNKMMDLLRPWQFQVSDFPFMDPSSAGFLRGFLLPGGQHDPSMWNGGQIFSLPGTVHSQNMVSNLIFNVTYASMELLSAQIRVFSCWNLLRYQHEAQENSKWRSDIREVMLLPTFRMVLGWNLKEHWFIGYVLHNDKDNYSASMILLVFASKQVWILYPTAGCFLQWFFLILWKRRRHLISLPSEILFQMNRFWELYSNLQALMGRATTRSNQTLKEYPFLLGLVSGATVWTSRALGVKTLKMVSGWVKLTIWIHEKQSFLRVPAM